MKKKSVSLNISYSLISMLLWLSYSFVSGYAAAFLMKGGFSSTWIGILISAASALAILFQTAGGFICDRWPRFGHRFFLCLILFISAALSLALCFFMSSRTALGFCFGLLMSVQIASATVIYAMANEYMNRFPDFHFGPARALGSLLSAAGMSIMGFILEHYAAFYMPLMIFSLNLFCLLAALFFLPGDKAGTASSAAPAPVSDYGYPAFIRAHIRLMLLFLGMLFIYMSASSIYNFQIDILKPLGGGSTELGISYAIGCITEVPFMFAFSFFASRFSSRSLVCAGAFFYFTKLGLFCFAARISMVYMAQLLQGPSYALLSMFSIRFVNENTRVHEKAKGQALLGMLSNGLAGIISSIAAGRMFDVLDTHQTVLIWFLLCAAGFLMVLLATRNPQSSKN